MHILVIVPTFENISTETYESLWLLNKQQDVEVDFKSIKGYDCGRARNEAVKYFLESDNCYSHLMMVDSDIILPKILDIDRLYLSKYLSEADIFLGWYPRKADSGRTELFMQGNYDSYPAAARWNCSELKQWPTDIISVKGGGFGCAIINREVLVSIPFPWFRYELRDDNTYISEDLYFCNKARKFGYSIKTIKTLACDHVSKQIVHA